MPTSMRQNTNSIFHPKRNFKANLLRFRKSGKVREKTYNNDFNKIAEILKMQTDELKEKGYYAYSLKEIKQKNK